MDRKKLIYFLEVNEVKLSKAYFLIPLSNFLQQFITQSLGLSDLKGRIT
jgi:hypothetical protein